jgi:hypothetical protein
MKNTKRTTRLTTVLAWLAVLACALAWAAPARAKSDAPSWMHALVSVPLPAHDEKTDAVLLYAEKTVTVLPDHRIKTLVRKAYKILRPTGRDYGVVLVSFDSHKKVTSIHGWCIPAEGKDYEVKEKDTAEVSLPKIEGSELISDVKDKLLRIPAPDPGNIIGYEYQTEEQPMVLQDGWAFQREVPVRESHYSLQLPPGWEYKASWLNAPEVKPAEEGGGWHWVVTDVKAIRSEDDMPPVAGIAGQMIVSFFPPGGRAADAFTTWRDMGTWYQGLTRGRRDPSPEIKEKVAALTASAPTPLAKMRALAAFVQKDVRYVAIEWGIGGVQPHPAPEVFTHRYGDCKDKATMMSSMLREIGIDSYYVSINSERGSVTPSSPAYVGGFDHVVIAIPLPAGVADPALVATLQYPKLVRLLFFDPTDEMTPFGQIRGPLQANYGMLVTPDGGELIALPMLPATLNSICRTAKLTLDAAGTLKGDVTEVRMGDRAASERWALRTVAKDSDRVKVVERLLAGSLASFHITKANVTSLQQTQQPLSLDYSFEAENYAKFAGNLILLRPRVIGSKSTGLLETKEPRRFPVVFDGPARDTDTFEVTLPLAYEVEDLPPPVDIDYSFASYHSKTEVNGHTIRYSRTFEVKELSVPLSGMDELKKFCRIIAGDERNTAVLRLASQ